MTDTGIAERLNNLIEEISFLESLDDSNMNKIVQVLKDKKRHSFLTSDRLEKIERLVNNYKKTIKTEQEGNQIRNVNPKAIDFVELCDDSSDDEIEFYEVNDCNEKVKPPNPRKDDNLDYIKIEKKEKQDDESDSDLEIIPCSDSSQTVNLEKSIVREKFKTEPVNEVDIVDDIDDDVIHIKEDILFTRRPNERRTSENDKSEKTDPNKLSNVTTNLQVISDTIQLSDTDDEDVQNLSSNKKNNIKISTVTSKTADTIIINNKIDLENGLTCEKLSEKVNMLKDAVNKHKENKEKSTDCLKFDFEKNLKKIFDKSNSVPDNKQNLNNYGSSEEKESVTTENEENRNEKLLGERSLNELQKIRLNLEKNLFSQAADKSTFATDNLINRDPRLNKPTSPTNQCSSQIFDHNVSAPFNSVNVITAFTPLANCNTAVLPIPLLPVTNLQMPPSIQNTVAALQIPPSIQNQVTSLQIPPSIQNPVSALQMLPSIQNQVTASQMPISTTLIQNPVSNLHITPHAIRNSSYPLNMNPLDNSPPLHSTASVTSKVINQHNNAQNSFIKNIPPAPHYSREGIIKSLEGSHLITSQTKIQEPNKQNNSHGSLYTKSRISYGEYKLQQQREAKLRAEREAHERALRQAEQLGLGVKTNTNLENGTEPNTTDQKILTKNLTKQKSNDESNSTHNVESDNNNVINKKNTLSLKKGRITGLSDSSSEDELADNQNRLKPQKQITKQNSELNNLTPNLEKSENTSKSNLCSDLIGALRENLVFLSEKQLENVQEIVESFMKNNPEENLSTVSNNVDNTNKINSIEDKIKEKTGKPNISRELKNLQKQFAGFYDSDKIMSIAGKNRVSSTVALQRITGKVDIENSQSDDELSKGNESNIQISSNNTKKSIKSNKIKKPVNDSSTENLKKPNEMHQKLIDQIKLLVKNLQTEKGFKHNTQPIFDEDENINTAINEDEYDTDDFTPHYKEFLSTDKKKVKKQKKFRKKEVKIMLQKIKPKNGKKIRKNNLIPQLKPLITITDLPQSEKQTKKTIKLRNTNINHHCLNENIMNKCLYCYKTYCNKTNNIVSHYVNSHFRRPGHEVYCARLPGLLIKKYKDNPPMGQLLEKDPYKYEVECIFCNVKVIGFHKEMEEHYATHTGEFAWQCSCNKKYAYKKDIINHCKSFCRERDSKYSKIYSYKKENKISAVYCTECNYIQLNKSNVIRHLQNHHLITREPERLCENLILVTFFRPSIANSMENPELTKSINEINENDFFIDEYENISVNNMTIIDQRVDKLIADINNHNTTNDDNRNKISNQFDTMEEIDIKPMILDGFEELDEIFKEANLQFETTNDSETHIKQELDNIVLSDYNGEVIHLDSDEEIDTNENVQITISETIPAKPVYFIDLDKKISLKPWLINNNTEEETSIQILSKTNLSDFYKCMLCPFSTNTDMSMLNHMKNHTYLNDNPMNYFECCYCSEKLKDSLELINHIRTEHFGCNFQCSECFYRSCSAFSVKLHIQMYHKKSTKILFCDGPEIPIINLIKIILENREQNLKPFTCHLCAGEVTKFYIEDDFANHIKTYHYNTPYCKCDQHELLCCLFCNFETNSIEQIRTHMTDTHSNREQYIAARFRNPKLKKKDLQKVKSITGKSTVIVFLSEVLQERYFVPSHNLKQNLQKIREEKKSFNLKLVSTSETFWNVKYLNKEIQNYKQLKSDKEFRIEPNISIEEYQNEFYEMAEIAVSHTGFEGKNLYKCLLNNCKIELENFGQWFNHIKIQHGYLLPKINKCPHCSKNFKIEEFQNHFFTKHTAHKYFCYLCPTTDSTVTALERHLQIQHRIVRAKTEIIIPHQKFLAVVPYDLFNDRNTILIHMRNILKLARYHIQIQNNDEYNNNNYINKKNSLKLPKYVLLQNRYKCCENNFCSFNSPSENMLENHLKNIHRCLKSFKCLHCSYKINEQLRDFECIKDHLRLHAETIFVCTECNFYHHQRKIVQNHIRSVHKLQISMTKIIRSHRNGMHHFAFEIDLEEGNIFLSLNSCLICQEDLIEPDKAIEHLNKKHSVTVFYECQYCKVLYDDLDKIIEHINKDHGKGINMRCKFEFNKSEEDILKEQNSTEILTLKRPRPESEILKQNLENGNQLFKKIKTEIQSDNCNDDSILLGASNQQLPYNKEPNINVENDNISNHNTISSPKSLKPKLPCIRVRPIESLICPDFIVKIPNHGFTK